MILFDVVAPDRGHMNGDARRVLERLERAARFSTGWICGSELEAIGGNRYGARLDELRALGAQIESKPGARTWHLYRLTGWAAPRAPRRRFDLPDRLLRALAGGELPAEVIADARRALGLHRQPELPLGG